MHALSSSSSLSAAAGRGARASTCSSALPNPALLLPRGGPLRHPRRRSNSAPVVLARSGSREEALRALESFGAGIAARVAVVASASPSELATAAAPASAALSSADGGPGLRELKADTFWPTIREEAGDKLVVVDFYTQWCGPCKLIYPKLVELSLQLEPRGVLMFKCDCNADFKAVGKELGIRVAPTFHLYRNGQKVAEMTGAHVERLAALVEEQLAGPSAAAEEGVVPV